LRKQLTAIQSSRVWRVVSVLSRVKMALRSAIAVFSRQRTGDSRGPLPEARIAQPPDQKPVQVPTRPQEQQDREP
jgi:hypothetical protein